MFGTMAANARLLFSVTGVVEAATGLALLIAPALLVQMLLGAAPDTPVGTTAARIAGAAVLSLAVVCWLARDDVVGKAARGLATAMLFYNFAVVAILVLGWLRRHRFLHRHSAGGRLWWLQSAVQG
jgi:hypothetical protein